MEFYSQPKLLGTCETELQEFMHYQYLPIKMIGNNKIYIEPRLKSVYPIIEKVIADIDKVYLLNHYLYLTARRGFATPENPINRPGWHSDGFLTDDINYIWWQGSGTRIAHQYFTNISQDHNKALEQFEKQIIKSNVLTYSEKTLIKLTPEVIHATPIISEPGEMRSFVKLSVSKHKYNLKGNSHNYLINYDWKMYSRDFARNHPTHSNADFIPET